MSYAGISLGEIIRLSKHELTLDDNMLVKKWKNQDLDEWDIKDLKNLLNKHSQDASEVFAPLFKDILIKILMFCLVLPGDSKFRSMKDAEHERLACFGARRRNPARKYTGPHPITIMFSHLAKFAQVSRWCRDLVMKFRAGDWCPPGFRKKWAWIVELEKAHTIHVSRLNNSRNKIVNLIAKYSNEVQLLIDEIWGRFSQNRENYGNARKVAYQYQKGANRVDPWDDEPRRRGKKPKLPKKPSQNFILAEIAKDSVRHTWTTVQIVVTKPAAIKKGIEKFPGQAYKFEPFMRLLRMYIAEKLGISMLSFTVEYIASPTSLIFVMKI